MSNREIAILKEMAIKYQIPYSALKRTSSISQQTTPLEDMEEKYISPRYYRWRIHLEKSHEAHEYKVRGVTKPLKGIVAGNFVMYNSRKTTTEQYCSFAKKLMPMLENKCKVYMDLLKASKVKSCFNDNPNCSCKDAMQYITHKLSEIEVHDGDDVESERKKNNAQKIRRRLLAEFI